MSSSSPPTIPAQLRTSISLHTPLLFTSRTKQPYLPLPHPLFPNRLALTLPHPTADLPPKLHTLNHPSVYPFLSGPPYPYTEADEQDWSSILLARWQECLKHWQRGEWKEGFNSCPCPVNCLRLASEEEEQGEGQWVGDLGVQRWRWEEVEQGRREELVRENEGSKVGEEGVVWSFGFFLHPSYHSLQIPTHALRTLLTTWFLPPHLLSAKHIRSAAYVGNEASRRVQEKCGMRGAVPLSRAEGEKKQDEEGEPIGILTYLHPVSESRGGGMQEVWVFDWQEARDGKLEARFLVSSDP